MPVLLGLLHLFTYLCIYLYPSLSFKKINTYSQLYKITQGNLHEKLGRKKNTRSINKDPERGKCKMALSLTHLFEQITSSVLTLSCNKAKKVKLNHEWSLQCPQNENRAGENKQFLMLRLSGSPFSKYVSPVPWSSIHNPLKFPKHQPRASIHYLNLWRIGFPRDFFLLRLKLFLNMHMVLKNIFFSNVNSLVH